jgi:plastocyanin
MRFPLRAPLVVTAGVAALAVAAAPASAAPQTVVVNNHSFTADAVTVNTGEAVTWNVQESGHNIDVISGPAAWRSTTGKEPAGAQVTHVFSQAGSYSYICDYHSGMKGTITVVDAPAQPGAPAAGGPAAGAPTPAGGSPQPVSGPAGPVTAGIAQVDGAAPTVAKPRLRDGVLRLHLSEPAKVTVRYVKTDGTAHTVVTRKLNAKKGENTFAMRRWMRPGHYRVSITAIDAAGNVSKPARIKATVRR